MEVPLGTITFLFTDIEGSSRLWERFPVNMGPALGAHDEILRTAARAHGGYVFKTIGDAFCIAFPGAADGLQAAVAAQRALWAHGWGETGPLRVRMALTTGDAEYRDDDYFGPTLNRVSRVLNAGHGGQLLLTQSTAELAGPPPSGVRLLDLGERRLRDLSRAERVFQAEIDELPNQFPPLRSLEVMPNNLPVQLTSFVGRELEMAEAKRLLARTHLLTLTGTGGTGKTRLSLQVAADLLDTFPGGVWFVELATISDLDLVDATVADALEVREESERSVLETLIKSLKSKKLLLVLDNCEHVLAACARLATALLRACPELKILASSRHSLGIAGEVMLPIPPLSMPNLFRDHFSGPRALDIITQYEAVRLFIERAKSVKPGFAATNENAPAIAEICWRLDGIPLALELAAARIKVLTPEQIATRLNDRFHLLTGGSRTALPRQQTLRALIDWSIDLLSEPETILLRRLGVFAGGRTLEGVEEVCAFGVVESWEVLDLLTQLVDKSLLTVEPGPDDTVRYTMIESVWQYCREALESSGEEAELRDRHLAYFLRYAEEVAPRLKGPEQARWLDVLDFEIGNMRRAMTWAATHPEHVREGLRLVTALLRAWEVRSNLQEGREQLEEMLAAPEAAPRDQVRALAVAALGRMAWLRDEDEDSNRYFNEARAIFLELHDPLNAARMQSFCGFTLRTLGRFDEAEQELLEALAIGEQLQSEELIGGAQSGLASVYGDRGEHARNLAMKLEALKIFRKIGDQWVIGMLLGAAIKAATLLERFDDVRTLLREWAEISRTLRGRWMLRYLLESFGNLEMKGGDFRRATELYGAVERLREETGTGSPDETHIVQVQQARLYEATISELKSKLGPEEFAQAWKIGTEMKPWAALDYALQMDTAEVAG